MTDSIDRSAAPAGAAPASGGAVSAGTPKIAIDDVTRRFGEVTALQQVNLSVAENEFVSLVGTSGCGKSTLLSIIAGLDAPDEGTVTVSGRGVTEPGRDRGVVFQRATLLPWLTAQGNVEFALRGERLSQAERRDAAREVLAQVGLEGFEGAYPSELSGGMQQRVALARSLSYRPDILLMDEPFGALDALTRADMQRLLIDVWERHRITVVFVTHDIEEAVLISDRVVVMSPRPGRIRAEVPIALDRPRGEHSREAPEFRAHAHDILAMIHERAAQ
ncbi:ABC transporter ATP-binding protein [Ruicaihuangia caeni]|uniref:ABC transporter ATP-binding protein n=1 Tax=Ruicaihuangia caeni TaxID=3042517 RepID=A0AAW6T945_9MICO|nr:ABC transporter ATP-binding protein [Klugiella sp. YN-L-19]MDI2099744.1 ABC transporter ATP-binding protein [Klugiella sp. YN-L-19]